MCVLISYYLNVRLYFLFITPFFFLFLYIELQAFVMHVPVKKSIQMEFVGGDSIGAITAHTCSSQLMLPRGVFTDTEESYLSFAMTIKSVVSCSFL